MTSSAECPGSEDLKPMLLFTLKKFEKVSDRRMVRLTRQQENYLKQLMGQGQENLNICPECFKNGQRKKYCTNVVLLRPEMVPVCCYLGDKHELSKNVFEKKVRDFQKQKL